MKEEEFTRLFKYMEKRFDAVDKRFEQTATKEQVDKLIDTVDGLAGTIKDYHQEMIMLAHKVDRMERWIHEIANKTGVKLSFE